MSTPNLTTYMSAGQPSQVISLRQRTLTATFTQSVQRATGCGASSFTMCPMQWVASMASFCHRTTLSLTSLARLTTSPLLWTLTNRRVRFKSSSRLTQWHLNKRPSIRLSSHCTMKNALKMASRTTTSLSWWLSIAPVLFTSSSFQAPTSKSNGTCKRSLITTSMTFPPC